MLQDIAFSPELGGQTNLLALRGANLDSEYTTAGSFAAFVDIALTHYYVTLTAGTP